MNQKREYQICKRCVMDTTDPDIVFDENGYCNHCTNAIKRLNDTIFRSDEIKQKELDDIIKSINSTSKKREYDCLIGLSGGADSSYLAYYIVKVLKLKPLAVHVDNGWNSELANMNINNIVSHLNIDLITHVIDWEEFKSLQRAFLKASVVDLEMLSDHAIGVINTKIAKKYNLKYYFTGYNLSTESIMPSGWLYPFKHDSLNIKDIYRKYGENKKLKTFPFLSFVKFLRFGKDKVKKIPLLNYINYNKEEVKELLFKELGWRDYGGKHYESIVTKFYQAYILHQKFNIDKRKAHLSSLICSNQISRKRALEIVEEPLYESNELKADIDYFCKKMNLTISDFDKIMREPRKEHLDFKSYVKIKRTIGKYLKRIFK